MSSTYRGAMRMSDSLPFVLEGALATRFCIGRSPGGADCRVLQPAADSLVMMFGPPTIDGPVGGIRWVFSPAR